MSPNKDNNQPDSRNISFATNNCDRTLKFDSTYDDCSFYSQARSNDLNQNNLVFMPDSQKAFSPPAFMKQMRPVHSAFSDKQTPAFCSPMESQFCKQPSDYVMPFSPFGQPSQQIFMDQSSFSNNIRSPCDSSTDFAPQETHPFTVSERSVS